MNALRRFFRSLVRLGGGSTFRFVDPADYHETTTLDDGTAITVRSIRPEDEANLVDLFTSLSEQSLYQRFFSVPNPIPPAMIRRLCRVDPRRTVALVVVLNAGDNEIIVAEGRYVRDEKTNFADMAFTVRDPYHGRGLGRLLVGRLVRIAREQRLAGFTAEMLATNAAMIHLFHTSGLDLEANQKAGICSMRIYLIRPARGGGFWRRIVGAFRRKGTRRAAPPQARGDTFNQLDI